MDYSALLTRPEWTFDEIAIDKHLYGKRVLITGAGGSIGSAVARRVSYANVESISLVDHSEIALFNLLGEQSITAPHRAWIVDIASRQMFGLIETVCPDIIIHAAAHKHVGLMEACPESAYQNNTIGTIKLARCAKEKGVGQFLFVSTDKAVNPSNYMGASKRLAEAWLFTQAREFAKVCRFGNVLGSSGSLVEIVTKKLFSGQPVQITDFDMQRYFITPNEAVGLLLSSLTLDGCGPFTIDMGLPIKVVDLVKRLAAKLDKFLEIESSQTGAGEKINEELVNPKEEVTVTKYPGICSLNSPGFRNATNLINSVGTRHIDMIDATRKLDIGAEDMFAI